MPKSKPLVWVIALLMVVQGALSFFVVQPRYLRDFVPKSTTTDGGNALSPELMFLQMFGFREFLAGILWVRADTFFETGDYDSILPIIRMTTWLDPHYIDVYATGMWHLGYNFTDEDGRSDRRYIPYALALGAEGANNNTETYEMFFETGWMWFHKVEDNFEKAVYWFDKANEREDMLPARRNLNANALQKAGDLDRAINWYADLLKKAEDSYKNSNEHSARTLRDTLEGNLDNLLVRLAARGQFASKRNDGSYERLPYDTKPPFDVKFSAQVTVEEPMVLRVQGTWGVQPVGTRIRFILRDADYPNAIPAGMQWDFADEVNLDPPSGLTWVQDGLFVKQQQFSRRIDLSRDPTMYPFAKKDYVVEFFYSPRNAPSHIQDKFGWNGEGMTDKRYLRTDVRPGERVMYCQMKLTRDQILREGEWLTKTPVIATPNYVQQKTSTAHQGDLIVVPGLRSEPKNQPPKQVPNLGTSSVGG